MPETPLFQNSYTCYFPKTSIVNKANRPCSLTKKKGQPNTVNDEYRVSKFVIFSKIPNENRDTRQL
jgi:hypothetical protein